jgi:hypothetical protein
VFPVSLGELMTTNSGKASAPMPNAARLQFATPAGPVDVDNASDQLIASFRAQAPEWLESVGQADGPARGRVTVSDNVGQFRFTSSSYETPEFAFPPGLVAGNGLIGSLIHTFVAASDDWIALHAGAVQTDGGLTVLAGDMMAGKSTLTAALVAQGHRLWCDDRLPVCRTSTGFDGMSLALRPKLRTPLPPNASARFVHFVGDRAGPEESDMKYLLLKKGEAAGFDERLSICRVVVLERDPAAGAPLVERLPLGEAVKRLTACTFAPHLGPVGLLERLRSVVETSECVALRYSDSFDAAEFAHAEWGAG